MFMIMITYVKLVLLSLFNMKQKCLKRAKIQFYHETGLKAIEIADKLQLHVNTVRKWINRKDVDDKSRSGRPTKLTPITKKMIMDELKETTTSSIRKCAKNLNLSNHFQTNQKKIATTTIQNHVKSTDWGKFAYKVQKTFFLTESNVFDRLYFAKFLINQGYCDLNLDGTLKRMHVLYTDESWIQLHQEPNRQNTRFRTNQHDKIPKYQLPKHPVKIMVAGGICGLGKTKLHIVNNGTTINAEYYRNNILPIYFTTMRDTSIMIDQELATLMQDGAPCHSAHETLNLIEKTIGDNYWGFGVWPGGSPDLNPIEHCWHLLQESVFKLPRPKNREELITRVEQTWESFDTAYLHSLVNSIPNRINELIEKKGHQTSY